MGGPAPADRDELPDLIAAATSGDVDASRTLERHLAATRDRIAVGDPAAVDVGLTFLDADPYFFRSGYERNRIASRLASVPLRPADRERARAVVVCSVAHGHPVGGPALPRLARSVADNELRRELRRQLHATDPAVAHRALRALAGVRRPGLTTGDLARARGLVLDGAARWDRLQPGVERLAAWLWSTSWADELHELTVVHGPRRAAARRLVRAAELRRRRRAARRERPGP